MPQGVETTVYTITELTGSAREHARDWYREQGLDHEWYGFVLEDFLEIATILGVAIRNEDAGKSREQDKRGPRIFFSGFSSQGDGACFEGTYGHEKGGLRKIREHAPNDEVLHAIARDLHDVQQRNFYQIQGIIRHRGLYCHEYTMNLELERINDTGQDLTEDAEQVVTEAMRRLARWLYRQLESSYEALTTAEAVDEIIEANDWRFRHDGEFFSVYH